MEFDPKQDEKIQKLENILKESNENSKALILTHAKPDIDALASQYTWSFILSNRFNINNEIASQGYVDHPSSEYLQKILNSHYETQPKKIKEINIKDYDLIFLFDTNPSLIQICPLNPNQIKENKDKIIVIDHHKKSKEHKKQNILLEDINNEDISSTSTRIIEYLKAWDIKFDTTKEEHKLLATSLKIGLDIDTLNSIQKGRDYLSMAYISEAINNNLYSSTRYRPFTEQEQTGIANGISNRVKVDTFVIGCAGYLISSNKATIAELAESLIREQGFDTGIGSAIIDNKLEISIRTNNEASKSAETIASWFGGLGRIYAGGATRELGILSEFPSDTEEVINVCQDYLKMVVKKNLGK